jgi:hypothetical protein
VIRGRDEEAVMGANRRSFARRCTDALHRCGRSARLLPTGLRRFIQLSAAERRTTLHALTVLLYVEATIRWTRLPRLSGTLGIGLQPQASTSGGRRLSAGGPLGPLVTSTERAPGTHFIEPVAEADLPEPVAEADLPEPVARARRSVGRWMRIWPLGAGPCLRESLVLGHLIRDRSPVLRLGVARHGYRMRAHAWIEVDGRPINDPQDFVAFDASDG